MGWLNKDGGSPSGPVQTDTVKRTFDVPIKMRVRNLQGPVDATLLHFALSACRLRSALQLDRGAAVSFEWRLSDGKLLNVAGVVAARYEPREKMPGFEYAVAVETMPEDEANALAREAAMLVRSVSARSYDTAVVDISQFTGYRVPDDVKVTYRIDNPRMFGIGEACDITGNALRLRCAEPLRRDETVYLSVRLPDFVLNVHKGSDDEMVTAPMTHKRVPRKLLRRPFEEIQLRGRVTGSVKDSKRRDSYELELVEVDGLARQELARYIHASHLARARK